jgi:hypothetical protein
MTLNVPEAEEQARTVQWRFGDSDMCGLMAAASTADNFLALAALARELAEAVKRSHGGDCPCPACEHAQAAGLLPGHRGSR